ncbi:MAG: rod shape-determining protein MreD [Spirochaetes bacterium]|nr:rod shape-determining protein MreD [Spirochaetota bacterium]
MIKTILFGSLLSSVLLLIQTTWLKNGLFWSIIPDFSLLVIIWIGYKNKDNQGTWTGFVTGLVCDLLSSSPLGYFSFILILPAYVVSFLRQIVVMDSFFIPVLFGFFGTIVKALGSLILLGLFGSDKVNAYSLGDIKLWVEAALNGALAPIVFYAMSKTKGFFITKKVTE